MHKSLRDISSSELADMVMKNTEYHMLLCKEDGNINKREVVEKYIDILKNEIKTRDGYKEVIESDLSAKATE